MLLSKAGAYALYAKKRLEKRNQPKHQYLIDHQNKYKAQLSKQKGNVYKYTQSPKGAWFLAFLFMTTAILLFYILMSVDTSDLTLWWRYLLIFMMFALGFIFGVSVDRQRIEIHREYNLLVIVRTNPLLCCRKRSIVKDFEQLERMRIVRRGHQAYQSSTIYYVIECVFRDCREILMEFNELRDAKLKYTEIRTFMRQEVDLGNINIDDESTHYNRTHNDESEFLVTQQSK